MGDDAGLSRLSELPPADRQAVLETFVDAVGPEAAETELAGRIREYETILDEAKNLHSVDEAIESDDCVRILRLLQEFRAMVKNTSDVFSVQK